MTYHSVKASTIVMGGNKDMIRTETTIPKRKLRRDVIYGGGNESTCMSDGREAINGAEVAGNINRHEEKVSLPWIMSTNIATLQSSVNCHLRSK